MTKEELIKTLEEYDKEVNKLFQENKKLKSRINKAIEFIKDNADYVEDINRCCDGLYDDDCDDLLKILKGEENDR